MKINVDLDLTAEEARKVMGLPDVEPMQKIMMEKIQKKVDQAVDEMTDPELLLKRYMPLGLQGMEQAQRFVSEIAKSVAGKSGSSNKT